MRPLPGDSITSASGASDDATSNPFLTSGSSSQMTFILTDEASLDDSFRTTTASTSVTRRIGDIHKAGSFPLFRSNSSSASSQTPCSRPIATGHQRTGSPQRSPKSPTCPTSAPMTPPLTGLSAPPSGFGSPMSRRDSLAASLSEDQGSLVLSTLDDSGVENSPSWSVKEQDIAVDSQLIMPTISVPMRRPFTSEGKSMGRIKVLVAGHMGLGKTSLIQAIIQSCQHIVHVDPSVPATTAEGRHVRSNTSQEGNERLSAVTETFASTKPYPSWWSYPDLPASKKRCIGDGILDRNVCFVDTPGLDVRSQVPGSGPEISRYVECNLQKSALRSLDDFEVLSTLGGGGGGGLLVDVILYMIPSTGLTGGEVELLRQLSPLTSIIPVLARADTLDSEQIELGKILIRDQLIEHGICTFSFNSEVVGGGEHLVYAVSSQAGDDHDTMDASLLMSSEYTPPLVHTDLTTLVDRLFSFEGGQQLRHSTLTKLLTWRKSNPPESMATTSRGELIYFHSTGIGNVVARRPAIGHHQDAGSWPRLRFVNWAADLQRSLLNERILYDERRLRRQASWAREQRMLRTGGASVSALAPRQDPENGASRSLRRWNASSNNSTWRGGPQQDPLGLLELATRFRYGSWQTIELLGSVGILGGVTVWMLS